jgi:hypothetical protein
VPKLKNLSPEQRDLLLDNFISHIGQECKVTVEWYDGGLKEEVVLVGAKFAESKKDS